MSNKFKQQATQQRTAIPQVDVESVKPMMAPLSVDVPPAPSPPPERHQSTPQSTPPAPRPMLTVVDTSETLTNRGFSMYPSRHRQLAKDLSYIEDRKPWEILDDALEEYVVKHYGKEYRRK